MMRGRAMSWATSTRMDDSSIAVFTSEMKQWCQSGELGNSIGMDYLKCLNPMEPAFDCSGPYCMKKRLNTFGSLRKSKACELESSQWVLPSLSFSCILLDALFVLAIGRGLHKFATAD